MKKFRVTFKFKPFSKKQKKVFTWWLPNSPVKDFDGLIADGAIRSGKTVSMALAFVMWATESFQGNNFAMCGKTVGSFRRNVWFWLKLMLLSRGYRYKDQKTENCIEIWKGDKVNTFYIFGGKDEASQDLIQGITLAGIFFDEVALMPESFVNQGTGRCSVEGSKFWFNCNPAGPSHWFKVNWIDKCKEKNLIHLHFTMDDNLSLSEKIKARFRSMYSGVFFKRYILGLWVQAEGAIYDMFNEDMTYEDVEIITRRRFITIDYGTANPTVFLDIHWDGKIHWVTREYYYDSRAVGRQKTDAEYADDLVEFIGDSKDVRVIIDPAAASFKVELRKRGIACIDAKNDVVEGIRVTASQFMTGKLRIHKSCVNLIKELFGYVWDSKASDKGEDKPLKVFDHACDALRYYCMTAILALRR